VVRHGREAVGAAAGSFAALDADARAFEVLASDGYEEETAKTFAHFPVTPGRPLSDAVLGGVPCYLSSFEDSDARYPEMAPVLRSTATTDHVANAVDGNASASTRQTTILFMTTLVSDPDCRVSGRSRASPLSRSLRRGRA